ncbi:ABC transporter substrate-binding protein, partial [Pseudomonas reactans]|nr:ABC transporter substrate-binding protein [Pseudomonas reactans]
MKNSPRNALIGLSCLPLTALLLAAPAQAEPTLYLGM